MLPILLWDDSVHQPTMSSKVPSISSSVFKIFRLASSDHSTRNFREEVLYSFQQFHYIERLFHNLIRPQPACSNSVTLPTESRNYNGPCLWIFPANPPDQLESVQAGHYKIGYYQVSFTLGLKSQCFFPFRSLDYLMPGLLQNLLDHFSYCFLIIDY